jgi:hypothetical protein
MDAILISADPNMVVVDDAIRHLASHDELYWEVGFAIVKDRLSFPILGFIHIRGGQCEYRATIRDIVPFSREHFEGPLGERVKPAAWRNEWTENLNGVRSRRWRNALVMTEIVPFSFDTCSFQKCDGTSVKQPPQNFIRVLPPTGLPETTGRPVGEPAVGRRQSPSVAERNLEDIVIHRLEDIEPGLHLVSRQLSTPAGRLDLLCKDSKERYVVLELKRRQGTDQVVGQVLRYMGWVMTEHQTSAVRGIIIVPRSDQALMYALRAVPNVEVKEFRLQIR